MCFIFCNFSACCLIHLGHIVMTLCTWSPTVVRKAVNLEMMRVVIICVMRKAKKFVWSVGKILPVVVLKVKFNLYSNFQGKFFLFYLFIYFFFYVGFLSRTFTNHSTAGKGGGYFINSSLPLPPASQTLRH